MSNYVDRGYKTLIEDLLCELLTNIIVNSVKDVTLFIYRVYLALDLDTLEGSACSWDIFKYVIQPVRGGPLKRYVYVTEDWGGGEH